jgi:predicted dehydrogenase
MTMIKIGIVGTGERALQHAEALASVSGFRISGVWTSSPAEPDAWYHKKRIPVFESFEALLQHSDAVDLISSKPDPFSLSAKAVKNSKHLFIDNPALFSPEEILKLIQLTSEAGVEVETNYPERFNPAYSASLSFLTKPLYIEAQRHLAFSGKNNEVPVVMDLMMHDIDIILSIVKGNIRMVHARGVNVFNGTPDIVNVNLEFDNGVVANLTANRIAAKNIRRMKFYQHKARIQADFLKHRIKILREQNGKTDNKFVIKDLKPPEKDPLVQALSVFYRRLTKQKGPVPGLDQVYQSLKTVFLINEKIEMLTS